MNQDFPKWTDILAEATALGRQEGILISLIEAVFNANSMTAAMGNLISIKLACAHMPEVIISELHAAFRARTKDAEAMLAADLISAMKNDPAATDGITPFLFFKGFQAVQAHRLAHYLWHANRKHLACFVQSRVAELFGVDIHPAAKLGRGIMMDHATGIVIGETAVVEDDVLFWHGVTLGGRGNAKGDRHPKVRKGAVLGACSTLLGNIEIGAGAKIAAGAIVVHDVPPSTTVAGPLAKRVDL